MALRMQYSQQRSEHAKEGFEMGKRQLLFVTYGGESLEEGVSYAIELAKAMYEDITLLLVKKPSNLLDKLGNLMTAVSFAEADEHVTALEIRFAGKAGCLRCEACGTHGPVQARGDLRERTADRARYGFRHPDLSQEPQRHRQGCAQPGHDRVRECNVQGPEPAGSHCFASDRDHDAAGGGGGVGGSEK